MSKKIRKAIIPVAGMGTRFLPATKAIPKEMIPIIDTPTIQFIVEEAVKSGIKEILFIISSNKNSIIDHFDYDYELQERLKTKNKTNLNEKIKQIANIADIFFIRQKEPLGLGHAIYLSKKFVDNEPFAVLLGDDVVITDNENDTPALAQCIETFNKFNSSVVGVQYVKDNEVNKYGIVDINNNIDETTFLLKGMVEKPNIENSPSNYAILGRYVFNPEIFDEIEKIHADTSGEIQLTPAIELLLKKQKVYAKKFVGNRYDMGSKFGLIKATIDIGLKHNETKNELINYLKEVNKKINQKGQ